MKELIELLRYTEINGDRDPQNYVTNLCGSCYLCEQAADALERLEKQVQKWIPVTERLPEDDKEVLVYWGSYHELGWYNHRDRSWRSDFFGCCTEDITHWMPLPEPPKGE